MHTKNFLIFFFSILCCFKNFVYLCNRNQNDGAIAQLVEQRTENPCVPGSIPGGTTEKERVNQMILSFFHTLPSSILFHFVSSEKKATLHNNTKGTMHFILTE